MKRMLTSCYFTPSLLAFFLVTLILLTAGNYGIFRDELYYLACAEHLDFGYVDHPPMVALAAWLSRFLFDGALWGLRLLPALAGGATVLLTAAIARQMGGGRFACALASLCIIASTALAALVSFLSMNAIELALWTVCALVLVRILKGGSPKLWLLFGLLAGLGLQTKWTMLVFGFGVVAAVLSTEHRKHFMTPWPWLGGAIALLIFLPNLVWQAAYDWPMIQFLSNAQQYKNINPNPLHFLLQYSLFSNPMLLPVWVGGVLFLLFGKEARTFRPVGLAFIAVILFFVLAASKFYYALPALPMVLAGGAVALERLSARRAWKWVAPVLTVLIAVVGILGLPLALPILPVDTFMAYWQSLGLAETVRFERGRVAALPQTFADRFGWREFVEDVARAYNSLPEDEKPRCAIMVNNYGRAAAIDYFGPALGLPKAISAHNNYWLWGPRGHSGEVCILAGYMDGSLNDLFESIEVAAVHRNRYAMPHENNVNIYLCRRAKRPLTEIWHRLKTYI